MGYPGAFQLKIPRCKSAALPKRTLISFFQETFNDRGGGYAGVSTSRIDASDICQVKGQAGGT